MDDGTNDSTSRVQSASPGHGRSVAGDGLLAGRAGDSGIVSAATATATDTDAGGH
ncbi:hypothetical protein SAMN04488124_3168 [Halogeometricum limi]|uniref:Uncharacterized protein n=1 Tax=Halogeometricum limi TaxID=555875 RepID=A0A1I6IES8_9EURY|nr:hypothetical protein SAMN04488124_3168 [Halogeometricum limi]